MQYSRKINVAKCFSEKGRRKTNITTHLMPPTRLGKVIYYFPIFLNFFRILSIVPKSCTDNFFVSNH